MGSGASKCRRSSRLPCSRGRSAKPPTSCRRKCIRSRTAAGNSITLRPEFTAGICRAYLSEGWQQYRAAQARGTRLRISLRAAAEGPLPRVPPARCRDHRRGRTAGGRRATRVRLPVAEGARHCRGVTLELNTLGDPETREAWRAALIQYFKGTEPTLSEDSVRGFSAIRCASSTAKTARQGDLRGAPSVRRLPDCRGGGFLRRCTAGVDAAGVPWKRNPRLVRGLDYYRHTAFEFVTDRLGRRVR